jgi:hypothetical protein
MKKLLEWENRTEKFKKGVCEAATMLWLSRLDNSGLEEAVKLKPEQCDDLQAKVEAGTSSFVWTLGPMLAGESSFKPYEAVKITATVFATLDVGDFLYLSISGGAQGHAMAVYRHRNGVYFFNPGEGIYHGRFVRQNVPLSPARHLSARALVVISPRSASYAAATSGGADREDAFPGPVFLAGKLLNALSLDRADDDIAQIGLVNRWLDAGTRRFGPDFVAELNRELASGGSPPLISIPLLHLDSSEDIGQIAAAYVRSPSFRARRLAFVERAIARLAEHQAAN